MGGQRKNEHIFSKDFLKGQSKIKNIFSKDFLKEESKKEHIFSEMFLNNVKAYLGIFDSDKKYPLYKKFFAEIKGEVSEEEIQNHYNVYVYKVLPYPPDKKKSLSQ